MMISFVQTKSKCVDCKKEYEQVYTLLNKNLCRGCLTGLAKLIYITVGHFDKIGNEKEDKVLAGLEKFLEKVKNMTNEEYLELFEKCKGTKDAALSECAALSVDY